MQSKAHCYSNASCHISPCSSSGSSETAKLQPELASFKDFRRLDSPGIAQQQTATLQLSLVLQSSPFSAALSFPSVQQAAAGVRHDAYPMDQPANEEKAADVAILDYTKAQHAMQSQIDDTEAMQLNQDAVQHAERLRQTDSPQQTAEVKQLGSVIDAGRETGRESGVYTAT